MTMKIGLVALATLAFATSASAATTTTENPFAQDQAILTLKGLDLSTAEGQQRLAIRLDQAARAVCGDRVASVSLVMESKAQECRTAVVADVRSQIEARLAGASAGTRLAYSR
jgi:UrcA family protein